MKHHIDQPIIERLEHLFWPPGLPLVDAVPDEARSTSVLVRGAAGAGKTTLALALAVDIARAGAGAVLYVGAEAPATDVAEKLELLGLARAVLPWSRREGVSLGVVVVDHVELGEPPLDVPPDEGPIADPLLQRAWSDATVDWAGPVPCRAVVLDAFGLLGAETPGRHARRHLLGLIQGLQAHGISTVLVAERGSDAAEWATYVVDVALDIGWSPRGDTGTLVRTLTVPKCRYGRALPGPHDYGLDEASRPVVWPDLLQVAMTSGESMEADRQRFGLGAVPPPLLLPAAAGAVRIDPGSLVAWGERSLDLHTLFDRAQGSASVHVRFGPVTRIGVIGRDGVRTPWWQGPHAWAWAVVSLGRIEPVGAVFVENVDVVEELGGYVHGLRNAVDGLRRVGFTVVLGPGHGQAWDLDAEVSRGLVVPIWTGSEVAWAEPAPCPAWRHLVRVPGGAAAVAGVEGLRAGDPSARRDARKLLGALGDPDDMLHVLDDAGLLWLATKWLGSQGLRPDSIRWSVRFGADAMAWRFCSAAEASLAEEFAFLGLHALYVDSAPALEALQAAIDTPDGDLAAVLVARTLARRGEVERGAVLVVETAKRLGRKIAEDRVAPDLAWETDDPDLWASAAARNLQCASSDAPVPSRAEAAWNAAGLFDRLGRTEDAERARALALGLNPGLKPE